MSGLRSIATVAAGLWLLLAGASSAQDRVQREVGRLEPRTWDHPAAALRSHDRGAALIAPRPQSVTAPMSFQPTSWYEMERTSVSFGEMEIGQESVATGALVLRVFSDVDWSLKLAPSAQLEVIGGARAVPISRLSWRTEGAGTFLPFANSGAITVVEGVRTTGTGRLVEVDLRLDLEDSDPAGLYGCRLHLRLERK